MTFEKKWKTLINNCSNGNKKCFLTLEQYNQLATDAGITDSSQIGRQRHQYQLGRIGDVGDYEIGNCRFITCEQNLVERKLNGGAESQASKIRGRNKSTDSSVASMAKIAASRNKLNHEGRRIQALKVSRPYRLISPTGEIFSGYSLREFCMNNSLDQSAMSKVCRGEGKQHKGWTGQYLD